MTSAGVMRAVEENVGAANVVERSSLRSREKTRTRRVPSLLSMLDEASFEIRVHV